MSVAGMQSYFPASSSELINSMSQSQPLPAAIHRRLSHDMTRRLQCQGNWHQTCGWVTMPH